MTSRSKLIVVLSFSLAGCSHSGHGGGGAMASTAPASLVAKTQAAKPVAVPASPATARPTTPAAQAKKTATPVTAAVSTATTPSAKTASTTIPTPKNVFPTPPGLLAGLFGGASQPMVELGQALFHDKILSGNKDVACSTCHNAGDALTDGKSVAFGTGAVGVGKNRVLATGAMMARNAPALFDTGSTAYGGSTQSLFWDNRVSFQPLDTPDPELTVTTASTEYRAVVAQLEGSLAAEALFPVLDPTEMRGAAGTNEIADAPDNVSAWKALMARLVGTSNGTVGGIPGYRTLFSAAYPGVAFDDLNFGHATRAIAEFVGQSFTATDTPYDDFVNGNQAALTASQQNGLALFMGKANCVACHSGSSFSDFQPHAAGVPQLGPGRLEAHEDRGVALVTSSTADNYKFRTPSLRNVALTGPYMHDGCYTTLEGAVRHMIDPRAAIAHYNAKQLEPEFAATLDTDPARIAARTAAIDPIFATPPALTDTEVSDVVSFLGALTDPSSVTRAQAAKPTSVPSGLPVD